jgi:hypothetical protein
MTLCGIVGEICGDFLGGEVRQGSRVFDDADRSLTPLHEVRRGGWLTPMYRSPVAAAA